MLEIRIEVPETTDSGSVVRAVERAFDDQALTCKLKGSLAGYPDSIHWHYGKGLEKGTLEITWWKKQRRLWIKVAGNRKGSWMPDAIPSLRDGIERNLSL